MAIDLPLPLNHSFASLFIDGLSFSELLTCMLNKRWVFNGSQGLVFCSFLLCKHKFWVLIKLRSHRANGRATD